jgi:hypothetical protein
VYILSELLPVEAQIHIRALRLFNNICNQAENSVEKTLDLQYWVQFPFFQINTAQIPKAVIIWNRLSRRQLIVKSNESNSWFIEIKNILRKYNMLEAWWYLDNAPKKAIWTTAVKKKIHEHSLRCPQPDYICY